MGSFFDEVHQLITDMDSELELQREEFDGLFKEYLLELLEQLEPSPTVH